MAAQRGPGSLSSSKRPGERRLQLPSEARAFTPGLSRQGESKGIVVQLKKGSFSMSRTSIAVFCLSLGTLSLSATDLAEARGGFNPNCRVPAIGLCPDCSVTVKITVLQDHECHINYGSMGPMRGQKILVSPKHGRYWADNETSTAYSPAKGFVGSDYFETRFSYELMNGSPASALLKATVEVVPHL
jgi:hypothetical protein